MSRMYVGRLSNRATERDVEHFFRGYGRLRDIVIKQGFAFVEFDDRRDAEDAMYDMNGKDLCGDRVVLEMARRDPRGRPFDERGGGGRGGRDSDRRSRSRDRGGRSPPRRGGNRFSPPHETRHRVIIENLTSRYTWQDLKDMFRTAGFEVTFADAHRNRQNEGVVCFKTSDELKKAIEKFNGKDINGREIKMIDDSRKSRSRSAGRRSRSRSGGRRSAGAAGSKRRSRGRSGSRSHSRSKSAGSAKSHSKSPARNGDKSDTEIFFCSSRSGTPKDD